MKHTHLAAFGGAAMLIAALAGCGSSTTDSGSSSTETSSGSAPETSAETAAAEAAVTIDGKEQNISGSITCPTMAGKVTIAIGDTNDGGLAIILSEGDNPTVSSVVLGSLSGSTLTYQEGLGSGSATATKDGQTYHVTGEAFSADIDLSNPSMGTKPFDITVTCP